MEKWSCERGATLMPLHVESWNYLLICVFILYLTMLSVAETIVRMITRLMGNAFERILQKALWPEGNKYHSIPLEDWGKSQESYYTLGQNLNCDLWSTKHRANWNYIWYYTYLENLRTFIKVKFYRISIEYKKITCSHAKMFYSFQFDSNN